jgi:hypothetical protein
MAKRNKGAATAVEPSPNINEHLTGIALTTEASRDSGFSNFRICTLFIVNGQIVHVEKSQEFALFETIARSEILMDRAHWHLSNCYKGGKFITLGGEDRDKLVNRLHAEDPELLARIAPALGLES